MDFVPLRSNILLPFHGIPPKLQLPQQGFNKATFSIPGLLQTAATFRFVSFGVYSIGRIERKQQMGIKDRGQRSEDRRKAARQQPIKHSIRGRLKSKFES